MLLKEYVNRIDEACGEGRDFIVILKYAKREEALRKILEKIDIERTLSRVMTKGRYENRDISVFVTGKLIMKGLQGRKEAEEILGKLLK
jgi:hypothetical protein